MSDSRPRGVFAGLATLDIVHRVIAPPARNEKITARMQFVAAGGPAANAAVTFAALGGRATLITALGRSPVARLIAAELESVRVEVIDVMPDLDAPAPVSSIAVSEESGDRAVIGGDAAGLVVPAPSTQMLEAALQDSVVLLLDGHHPEVAAAAAEAAVARRLPIVMDAGRWKPAFATLLPRATDVVMSADFRMPDADDAAATAAQLVSQGIPAVVATAGADPVRWWSEGQAGTVEVPQVHAVDTLAAGDVFHGAYAFALARGADLKTRIAFAGSVAATRCGMIGPRSWLDAVAAIPLDPNRGDR
ncbi:PfkB family carbohydrate kinase [Microbacterium sp.]|uniref:PfkB family carbohydrate kinase n=1 Tax=Microbacterium sp. TaxID=51671 RepID=UPI0028114478|nr:PfkB family carbohydrate kinase [Microbacterium sp.]